MRKATEILLSLEAKIDEILGHLNQFTYLLTFK